MFILQIKPLITDWIQAIGVLLGVPITIISIFRLVRANKKKDKKLEALEDLSISHNSLLGRMKDQIGELRNQTETLIIHNQLVKESNVLQKEQVEILRESIATGVLQNEKYLESVEKSRKADNKPYFKSHPGMSDSEVIKLNLKNIGENAIMDEPEKVENEYVWVKFEYKSGFVVETEHQIAIELRTKHKENSFRDNKVEFNIYFSNMRGDKYCQKITFSKKKYTVGIPEVL